jgi:RimJ/RimL family protein N-acetyltransferase
MICDDGIGLRLVLADDLPLLECWRDDESARAMFYSLALTSETALHNWLKALLGDPTRMRFMIQRLKDSATIGIIGLEHIDYRNQVAELAGLIIAPSERKQGWGAKALGVLIRYGFDDLNLHRLYARLYDSNRAARCVAEKVGLQNEGVARQSVFYNWKYEDIVYMAILREEWKREPAAAAAVR